MKNLKRILCVFAMVLTSHQVFAGTYFEPSIGYMLDAETEDGGLGAAGDADLDNFAVNFGLIIGHKFINGIKLGVAAHMGDLDFEDGGGDVKLFDAGAELGYDFSNGVGVFVGYTLIGSLEADNGEFSEMSGLYYGLAANRLPYGLNAKITIGERDFGERSGFGQATIAPNTTFRTANFSIGWAWDIFGGRATRSRGGARGRRYRRR